VASDKYAIGYSGVGYKTADVKIVPLAMKEGQTYYDADAKSAYSGDYPLARFLYIYLNKNPNQDLDPLRKEFIKYVFSKQGQQVVVKDGFFPVSSEIVQKDMAALAIK
jgi:phosphate transport system substrate-binding protein